MTKNEAQNRFSEALEGTLSAQEQHAFDQALNADPELKKSFEDFTQLFRGEEGLPAFAQTNEPGAEVDLLAGVQERLRKRSRGRYYRDRFAQTGAKEVWTVAVVAGLIVMLVMGTWWAMHEVQLETPATLERR